VAVDRLCLWLATASRAAVCYAVLTSDELRLWKVPSDLSRKFCWICAKWTYGWALPADLRAVFPPIPLDGDPLVFFLFSSFFS